ncbi:hypothetical protein COW46_03165 [Candidatus Gracilibacteria bacterium CG17_big_fil_post_rev_8_21_14_2_50_48_13]|nr:MAG: hypothetical protein COW46_03165 [Candidatus Gracilibacteria bacterium CG17_big_fil_post_rev_8_21_14_2_50_48_13]
MDFSSLFALAPTESFASLPILLTFFSSTLIASMLLMIFSRLRPLRKELRTELGKLITGVFSFSMAGFLLVIFRLSETPVLSMRALYLLWGILFIAYLYHRFVAFRKTLRLITRKDANRAKEKEEAAKNAPDPYVVAQMKGKKKKR